MKKILIIEDNLEVRENTAEIIELANYEVITAANGKIGVELALKEDPDLIICDIMMPVLDGYGVHHLLSKHEQTSLIPFIFLTAKSEKNDIRKGMQLGAEDYITKPFDSVELLTAIEVRLKKGELLKTKYGGPGAANKFLEEIQSTTMINLISDDREINNYNTKQFVYKEGQRPKNVYYVVSGKIKVSRTNDEGKEFITNIYSTGDYFGYIPILENTNYKDQAQILEEAKMVLIAKEDFLQLISMDREFAQIFLKIISQSISANDEKLVNIAYNSLRKKVASGLLQLSEKYKYDGCLQPDLALSRVNMAQTIGIATESLIRTLSDFKNEKLIKILNGNVVVINEIGLRELPN